MDVFRFVCTFLGSGRKRSFSSPRRAGRARRPIPIAPHWSRPSSKRRSPNASGRPRASTARRAFAPFSSDAAAPYSSRATARRSNSSRRRSCGCHSPRAANFALPPAATARRCWRARTSSGGRSARTRYPRNCGPCSTALLVPPPAGLAEIDLLFGALARESREPGPGALVIAGLYLGLLLMRLWREADWAGLGRAGRRRAGRATFPTAGRTALSRQPRPRGLCAKARRDARPFA